MLLRMPTPIVLIPGLYATPRLYFEQLPALWRLGPVTVADHTTHDDVDAIAAEILATAPPRFALAGLSMGGYVALAVQRAAPERVERLALLDTAATPDVEAVRDIRLHQIELAREDRWEEILEESWPWLVHESRLGEQQLRDVLLQMYRETGSEAAIRQQTAIMNRPDARPALAAIAVPTLVLVGDADQLTPPERSAEIAEAIPHARLTTIADAGHMTAMERPEEVTRELVAWLTA